MKKVVFLCLWASLAFAEGVDRRSTLAVRGEASLYKPADELKMSLGVVSQADSAEEAVSECRKTMGEVIQALEKEGISKKEYSLGYFNIQPLWSQQVGQQQGPQKEVPSIVGYKASYNILIRTDQIGKAGLLIDKASRAGANSVDSLHFGLRDARSFREEAMGVAAANAMADASSLALAVRQKLVRILNVALDDARPEPIVGRNLSMLMTKGAGEIPINPGEVEVTASVTLVYEIAP
jgi:hypothetical protein